LASRAADLQSEERAVCPSCGTALHDGGLHQRTLVSAIRFLETGGQPPGDEEQGKRLDNLLVDAGRDSQPLVNGEKQYPCGGD
jgi:hypothetical protein